MAQLTTDRLTLTPVSREDYEDFRSLWADEGFTRLITGRPLSGEEVWFRVLRDIGHWAAMGYGNWTLRRREDGAFVGSVGVLEYRRELEPAFGAPELGWGLASAHQGQGYATEAVEAALRHADETLKAARTACMIDPGNTPSVRLAERVGYRAYARTTYKEHPVILYERLRP